MKQELENLKKNGLLRRLITSRSEGVDILVNGKKFLNFSSNDYLGISSRLDLQKEFFESLPNYTSKFLLGSSASRLLTGNFEEFSLLEDRLTHAYKKEAALVFNSGYHANTGILPALTNSKDLILADKLVHASLIDALNLSKAKFFRYAHNDMQHLEKLLEQNRKDFENVYIVTESIFSMDGDKANLKKIIELKKRFKAMLFLDEAHAIGVLGATGLGLAEEENCIEDVDLLLATFGKALASEGAFVVCSAVIKELLVNKSRSLIFSTAIAPINILWTIFIFEKMRSMNFSRCKLRNLQELFGSAISEIKAESQILPLIVGDNQKCLKYSEFLSKNDIWAAAIRHPTVPLNTARIRFSLSSAMSPENIKFVVEKIWEAKEILK